MVSEAGNSGTGTGAHDLVQSLHSAIGGGEGPRTEDGARGMLRGVEGNRFSGAGAECEVGASRGRGEKFVILEEHTSLRS